MPQKTKALLHDRDKMRELCSDVFFGILTTLISWLTYFVWRQALGLTRYPADSAAYMLIANSGQVLAFILSVAFAFFTNKRYVFKSERTAQNGLWREMWLFVSSRILAALLFDLGLFNLCLWLVRGVWPGADLWVKLLMNVLVVIFNYVISKFVVFKRKKDEHENPV